ncbi:MAG: hypothetical protein WC505_03750 [Patescibacteria group bacterium]
MKLQAHFIYTFVAGVIILIAVLMTAAALYYQYCQDDAQGSVAVISSFEDCAAAGNPVMESYPRQCVAGGRTFTESPANANQLLGGDEDEHGCKASAGYSWCEEKQKCLRTWEEACESATDAATGD